MSALTRYADGMAQLGAVSRLVEYVVLAFAAVAGAVFLGCGAAALARRRWRPAARHAALRLRPGPARECAGALIPAARRAPDDLTV